MIVITLEKCPLSLRGDLTKWLQEISLGVYVGNVSARVRDKLWDRVCEEAKSGRATMVFTARNEQHYDFRVHNATWEPIEFEGLKLMMRPSPSRVKELGKKRTGFSKASQGHRARGGKIKGNIDPSAFAIIDIETTGLDCEKDDIIEIAAIKVVNGEITNEYDQLILIDSNIPNKISHLTGITEEVLEEKGIALPLALDGLFDVIGNLPIVGHNIMFDADFLQEACDKYDFGDLDNECIDTLELSRKKVPSLGSYRLEDLAKHFEIEAKAPHRALSDCRVDLELFRKLNEM